MADKIFVKVIYEGHTLSVRNYNLAEEEERRKSRRRRR